MQGEWLPDRLKVEMADVGSTPFLREVSKARHPVLCLDPLPCPLSPLSLNSFSPSKVIAGFNRLRQEQRGLASKAAELEMELNEHR